MLGVEPGNEEETIELYESAQNCLGWRIVYLQRPFPDAIIENVRGQRLVAEFEYEAKNFHYHKHDPTGCDLIICWRNNWPDAPLPVWALDNSLPVSYWKQQLGMTRQRLKATKAEMEYLNSILAHQRMKLAFLEPAGSVEIAHVGKVYCTSSKELERFNFFIREIEPYVSGVMNARDTLDALANL